MCAVLGRFDELMFCFIFFFNSKLCDLECTIRTMLKNKADMNIFFVWVNACVIHLIRHVLP